MTNYFVYHLGGNTDGLTWANAYANLAGAVTGKAAGDVFYVAHDHAESTAGSTTCSFPGTAASPNFVYCVNRSGTGAPAITSADLRTTATATLTGTASWTLSGGGYVYGITFIAGNSSTISSVVLTGGTLQLEN